MINLLPPDLKENIVYARRNTLLRRWTLATLFSGLFLATIVGFGFLYLHQSIKAYNSQVIAGTAELKAQKLDETQGKVQQLSNDLKLVVQVLQKEVLFSKLISQIGSALPNGAVLTSLSINKLSGGLDLQVATTTSQTATQVQLNLQDPKNQIFEKADLVNIQCVTDANTLASDPLKAQYPCTAQVRALFTKNSPFSFITPSKSSSGTSSGSKP